MIKKTQEWIKNGRQVALATVIATWGSSSRQAGSQLVVDASGRFEGSVSGGCVEGAVVEEALAVIREGKPKRMFFGVTQDQAWEVGLACGGEIEIFIEKVTWVADLDRLAALCAASRPVCLITDLAGGQKQLVSLDEPGAVEALSSDMRPHVEQLIRGGRNTVVEAGGRPFFLHRFYPPPELIVVGAVHIAKPLCVFARTTGYRVTVIDPRSAFANPDRFPDVPFRVQWPDEAMEQMKLHHATAVVALCHDPKIDDPALAAALKSDAFYIGALGSRKTHKERLERLCSSGFSDDTLKRIHGPVGLDIGALDPEEIAIAIMAEITAVRRNGNGS